MMLLNIVVVLVVVGLVLWLINTYNSDGRIDQKLTQYRGVCCCADLGIASVRTNRAYSRDSHSAPQLERTGRYSVAFVRVDLQVTETGKLAAPEILIAHFLDPTKYRC
jgi:hypothetical protein